MNFHLSITLRHVSKWLYLLLCASAYFLGVAAIFLLIQKPLFLIFSLPDNVQLSAPEVWHIYRHGLTLDLAACAYLSAMPLILYILSVWIPKLMVNRIFAVYNCIIAFTLALLIVADCVLYTFWGFKIDSTVLLYLKDLDKLGQNVSWGYMAGAIAAVAVLFLLIWWWLNFICIKVAVLTARESSLKWKCVQSLEFVITGAILFIFARGIEIWPKTPANSYYSEVQCFNHAAVNPLFNFIYSLSYQGKNFDEFQFFYTDTVERDVRAWYPTQSTDTDKIINTDRPDILLITIEGMGACFIKELGGLDGVTPNMDSLINDSYAFTQCYASSFRTDRGLVAILSGFPGQPTTSAMRYHHVIRALPGIARSLADKAGYSTTAMLGGDASFFNMVDYLAAVGHQKVIDIHDFPDSEKTTEWGVPDHLLFKRALTELNTDHTSPHYTFLLTQSSHTPFDVPYHKLKDEKLNAFAYTDESIGEFLNELKRTPAWANLMVIITADHGFRYGAFSDPPYHHIPLLVTGGALSKKSKDSRIVSQTDIPAMILGQLELPHDDFQFSRDIMSKNYSYPFSFSTFVNGLTFRDSTGVTVYDNVLHKAVHYPDSIRTRKGKEILQNVYRKLKIMNS